MRPDMRVNLAEGKHVFVDSKVPLTAFLEAAEADDETVRAEALGRYGKHVRTHVDQLSAKQYWKGAETPEFVVLFLPSEAFFAAALDQIPDLYEYGAAAGRRAGHPDHADRAAARGRVRLEAGGAGRERGRGVPAGPGAARTARPDGQPVRQAGPGAADSVNAYNETVATVEGTVLVRAPPVPRPEGQRAPSCWPDQSVDEPSGRSRRPSWSRTRSRWSRWSAGRARRRRATVPEAAELVRGEPDLLELVEGEIEAPRGARGPHLLTRSPRYSLLRYCATVCTLSARTLSSRCRDDKRCKRGTAGAAVSRRRRRA